MAAIITDDFRRNQARLLVNDIKASADSNFDSPASNSVETSWPYRGNNRYAIGLGKADTWANDANGAAEDATAFIIPAPDGTIQEDHDIINNLFTLKDIAGANVKQLIAKNAWTSGRKYKVYDQSDDDMFYTTGDLYPSVVTVGSSIYMCLSNTAINGGFTTVLQSTTTPSASSFALSTPAQGYVWAHVASFDSNDSLATNQFSPVNVQSPTVVQIDKTGFLLTHIGVTNGGSGYTTPPTVTLTLVTAAGVKIPSTAISAIAVVESGVITRIDIRDVSSNLLHAGSYEYWTSEASGFLEVEASKAGRIAFATVSITGGGGSGATAYASIAPISGFGKNALDILPTWFVGIHTDFDGSETDGDAPTLNFRQVSLLKNFDSTSALVETDGGGILDCLSSITLTTPNLANIGNLTEGDVLVSGDSKFYFNYAETISGTTKIYYHQNSNSDVNMITPIAASSNVETVGSTTIAATISVVNRNTEYNIFGASPNKRNGEVIFQENRQPFGRSTSQTEEVKLIIQL